VAEAATLIATNGDEVNSLDQLLQQDLAESGGGLARTCLTMSELTPGFGSVLTELAESLLESRLGTNGATELFLAQYPGEEAKKALRAAWQAASPPLAAQAGQSEVTTIITPSSLSDVVMQVFGAEAQMLNSDEIVVQRTVSRLPLAALPQLGPAALATYLKRKSSDESPHSRVDIVVWQKD
jgi:hypothetical protein